MKESINVLLLPVVLFLSLYSMVVHASETTSYAGTNCQEDVGVGSSSLYHGIGGSAYLATNAKKGYVTVNCSLDMTSNIAGQSQGYKSIYVYYIDGSDAYDVECIVQLRSIIGSWSSYVSKVGKYPASSSVRGFGFPAVNSSYASPMGFMRCYLPKPDAGHITKLISYSITR